MSVAACVLRWSSQVQWRRAEKGGGASASASASASSASRRPPKPYLFSAGEAPNRFPENLLFPRSASRGGVTRKAQSQAIRRFTTVMAQWQDCSSEIEILQDKPDLSRWSLKYEVFGRNVEFSWLARNMQPIPNQKIHWRSLEGLPNRGAVRFFPTGPSSCRVQLTVSYEIPEILAPVASALKPFLEGLLASGLERFATFARDYERKIPQR